MTLFLPAPTSRPPIYGTSYMVSSGHYLASMAAVRILERGGNAIDAGVAAGMALNVVQPDEASFGGVAPILVYQADSGRVASISGLGRAPRAATLELYRQRYRDRVPIGIPRAVIPATPDAWITALERFGTMSFADVAAPAIELADGFLMYEQLCNNLSSARDNLAGWPGSRAVFLPNGDVPRPGELFRQSDLASTLRALAEAERGAVPDGRSAGLRAARDEFYRGEIARAMVRFCRAEGGLLQEQDLADFSVAVEEPVATDYRGYRVFTNGFWCQGPLLLQALNVLEGYDLPALGHNSTDYVHLVIETLKLGAADRERYQGDPDVVRVPQRGLLSKEYADHQRARIDRLRAHDGMPPAGNPWRYDDSDQQAHDAVAPTGGAAPVPGRLDTITPDTTYVCVVDRQGNAFVATPSDIATEAPLVPGLGFLISNRGSQFWLDPDHPSALAPWKRPRLTPMASLVTRDGKLALIVGTPGGDTQPQATLQTLLNVVEFGMNVQEAIEAPRFATFSFPNSFMPHAYEPNLLRLEDRIGGAAMGELARRGHRVDPWPAWSPLSGVMCAIAVDAQRHYLAGAADRRKTAYAIGR